MAQQDLEIGVVLGVLGVRGALIVRLLAADSNALVVGRTLHLRAASSGQGPQTPLSQPFSAKLSRVSPKPGTDKVRVWLEGLQDRDTAMSLRGYRAFVERGELDPLEDDEYYLADLVGLQLRHVQAPELSLGHIEAIVDNQLQDLLSVAWQPPQGGKTLRWLLPAVGPYIERIDDQVLWICAPVGLLPQALESQVDPS